MKSLFKSMLAMFLAITSLVTVPVSQVFSQESRIPYINQVDEDNIIDLADYQGLYASYSSKISIEGESLTLDDYYSLITGDLEHVRGNLYKISADSYNEKITYDVASAKASLEDDDYMAEMILNYYNNYNIIIDKLDTYDEAYQSFLDYLLNSTQLNEDESILTIDLNGQEALLHQQTVDFENIPEEFKVFYSLFASVAQNIADFEEADAYYANLFKFEDQKIYHYITRKHPQIEYASSDFESEYQLVESYNDSPVTQYRPLSADQGPETGIYINSNDNDPYTMMTYDGQIFTIKQSLSDEEYQDEFIIYQSPLSEDQEGYLLIPDQMTIQVSGSRSNPEIGALLGDVNHFINGQERIPRETELGQAYHQFMNENFLVLTEEDVAFSLSLEEFEPYTTWLGNRLGMKFEVFNSISDKESYEESNEVFLNSLSQYFISDHHSALQFYIEPQEDQLVLYQKTGQGDLASSEEIASFRYYQAQNFDLESIPMEKISDQLIYLQALRGDVSNQSFDLRDSYISSDAFRQINIDTQSLELTYKFQRPGTHLIVKGDLEALANNFYRLNPSSMTIENHYDLEDQGYHHTVKTAYQSLLDDSETYTGNLADFANYLLDEVYYLEEDQLNEQIDVVSASEWVDLLEESQIPDSIHSLYQQVNFAVSYMREEYNGLEEFGAYYIEALGDGLYLYHISNLISPAFQTSFNVDYSAHIIGELSGDYLQTEGKEQTLTLAENRIQADLEGFFHDEDRILIEGQLKQMTINGEDILLIDPLTLNTSFIYQNPEHPLAKAREQLTHQPESDDPQVTEWLDDVLENIYLQEDGQTVMHFNYDIANNALGPVPNYFIHENADLQVFAYLSQKIMEFYFLPPQAPLAITKQFISVDAQEDYIYLYHNYMFSDGRLMQREIGQFHK